MKEVAPASRAATFRKIGQCLIRYGLVIVLGWIGAMKFTAYEAKGIEGLIKTSPLMSWLYNFLSLQGASNLIGLTELLAAVLPAGVDAALAERRRRALQRSSLAVPGSRILPGYFHAP